MRELGAVLTIVIAVGGCNTKKAADEGTDGGVAGDAGDAGDAGVAMQAMVLALPGCQPVVPGGTELADLGQGVLSIAAASGKALVVSSGTEGESATPLVAPRRVLLGSTGAPEGRAESIGEGDAGAATPAIAAAIAMGSELTTLAYGARRATGKDCADGILAAQATTEGAPRRELALREPKVRACASGSHLRAAARGKIAIAVAPGRNAPRVDAWGTDGKEAWVVPLETIAAATGKDAGGPPTIDVTAVATDSFGGAVAYVVGHGSGPSRALHVARLGAHGEPPVRVEILDKEHVGTATMAFERDTLHVVWSSFVPEKKRFVLRWAKWPAGAPPTAPQTIGTGVLSATTPALAIDHGRFVLAWTEGGGNATTVKLGASRGGLQPIPGLARVVSTTGVSADAPVVAMDVDGDAIFAAWNEHDAAHTRTSVRASAVKCLE